VAEVVEEELGAQVTVAVVEVLEIHDVLVLDSPRVLGVPPAQDERRGQDLVAQLAEVDLAVVAVHLGEEDFLHRFPWQWVSSLTPMVAPLVFALESLLNIQHGGVLLPVVLVEGRSAVVCEDVVDVAMSLRDVGLAPVLPALHEKLLHVLVGDLGDGRDDVAPGGAPLQSVHLRKLPGVQ